MQQFARELSHDALAEKAGVSSAHTMQTYVSYLEESYLVSRVRKYATKPAERIRNDKLYVAAPPLFGAGKKLGCEKLTLVTDHERETVQNGAQVVEVVPARDWLRERG